MDEFRESLCRGSVMSRFHLVVGALILATGSAVSASEPNPDRTPAETLVQEALHLEIYGMQSKRDQLLREAAEDGACKQARWHQGLIQYKGKWVPASELASASGLDRDLQKYHARRGEAENTAESQLRLANWCREMDLPAQEVAHLNRVIQLNPNHTQARRRLGYVQVDGIWVTRQEMYEARVDARNIMKNMAKWRPRMHELRSQMAQRSIKKQEAAAQQILALSDATAIPAMEDILSADENTAKLVVKALSNMKETEAAVSLARHSVFSPFASVREEAALALQDRPFADFVPVMLSAMYLPVMSFLDVEMSEQGRLVYRHRFLREGQSERQLLDTETQYERLGRQNGDRRETLSRAVSDARGRAQQREQQVARQNVRTQQMNDRIASSLRTATGQSFGSAPRDWWNWWNDHNDIYVSGDKPIRTQYDFDEVYVADQAQFSPGASGGARGGAGVQASCECLAAGTPVWTSRGPVAVEKMQVGDMVVSQDPESGELALKPVIRTTVRPIGRVINIHYDDTKIEASAGHLFWVSGEGWRTAKEIDSGMLLHTTEGTVRVSHVDEGKEQETFNLIVDDFHTYFAGKLRVLCHDNATPKATSNPVPGLK